MRGCVASNVIKAEGCPSCAFDDARGTGTVIEAEGCAFDVRGTSNVIEGEGCSSCGFDDARGTSNVVEGEGCAFDMRGTDNVVLTIWIACCRELEVGRLLDQACAIRN